MKDRTMLQATLVLKRISMNFTSPRIHLRRRDQLLSPLDHRELLVGGRLYYLFPLAGDEKDQNMKEKDQNMKEKASSGLEPVRVSSVAEGEPVRMSTSAVVLQLVTKKLSDGSGFEEVNTEALIEQMRRAAASSMTVGPRRSKGYWGINLKPIFCNVMHKVVVDDSSSPKSVSPLLQQQTK
ncbi:hypothetical protein Tco_0937974 [Tanacetum coccineum]|uniref:Uncharacterized protein n=1 Tax=Tanacetum coccineum TaxID=301880 RepID=A0ABQ5DMU3_9ASTR